MTATFTPSPALPRAFWLALGVNFLWMNASEVFRCFAFVMPMMREALPGIVGVAPMNLPVFLVWGIWDTVLIGATTSVCWLMLTRFGPSVRPALVAGTLVWAAVFVLLWLALRNMNLATPPIIAAALPLAWVELAVAGLITRWALLRS